MIRKLVAGMFAIVCCSCVVIDHRRPPRGVAHRLNDGIRINDPSFRINVDSGELKFFSTGPQAIPDPEWRYKNRYPGTVYFVESPTGETPASCTYTSDTSKLSVSDLVDYLNQHCLPLGCSLSVKNPLSTVIELDTSCAKGITFVVRKSSWSKSAGITVTLEPGGSVDLADTTTSPLVGTYTVVS